MHELGYVHNDLKLDNFLIGLNDPKIIYLIDFGISSAYKNEDGTHIKKLRYTSFSGNFMFASLSSISKYSQSRRDDMQSLFYVMIFLLNNGSLPWTDFGKKFKGNNYTFEDYLRERVNVKYSREVMDLCPDNLKGIMKKVLLLGFVDTPPYDEIIDKIKKEIARDVQIGPDLEPIIHEFEWQQNIASRVRAKYLREL